MKCPWPLDVPLHVLIYILDGLYLQAETMLILMQPNIMHQIYQRLLRTSQI